MFFYFNRNPYIAIIGDIKDSKKLENRNDVQKKLYKVLNDINMKYEHVIGSKFIITLGDEFQGLLSKGNHVMDIVSDIERNMYPIKIRFGIGVGEIRTEINKEWSIGADGPAYYNARSAIEYLKEAEKKKRAVGTGIRFEIDGDNEAVTIMLNTILSLMETVKSSWSDRQREIIWDMLEHQDSQTEVAGRLGIRQPTVQKSLAKGNYYCYKEAFDTVGKALEEIQREDAVLDYGTFDCS